MSGEISIWRIASEGHTWKANDLCGWDSAPSLEHVENRFAATLAWGDDWLFWGGAAGAGDWEQGLKLGSISPLSQDQVAEFTKAGSAKEPLELIAIVAGPVAPEVSLRRAPSSRAVPRMWPAKMSRFTLRLGSWK